MGAAKALGNSPTRALVSSLIREEVRSAALAALLFVLALPLAWSIIAAGEPIVPYLLVATPGIIFRLTGVTSASYRALGRERDLAIALVALAAGRLLVIIGLAAMRCPMWLVLMGSTAVDLVCATYHRQKLSKHCFGNREVDLSRGDFKTSSGWMLVVATLDSAVNSLDRVIVGVVLGQQAIGVYYVIRRYAYAIGMVADPFYQTFSTQFSRMMAEARSAQIYRAPFQFARKAGCAAIPLAIVGALCQPIWQPLLMPGFSTNAIAAFYVVGAGYVLALCFTAVHPALMIVDRWRATVLITAVANVTFVIAAVLLGDVYGIIGVAMAIFLQFFLSVAPKTWICARMVKRDNVIDGGPARDRAQRL